MSREHLLHFHRGESHQQVVKAGDYSTDGRRESKNIHYFFKKAIFVFLVNKERFPQESYITISDSHIWEGGGNLAFG